MKQKLQKPIESDVWPQSVNIWRYNVVAWLSHWQSKRLLSDRWCWRVVQ